MATGMADIYLSLLNFICDLPQSSLHSSASMHDRQWSREENAMGSSNLSIEGNVECYNLICALY